MPPLDLLPLKVQVKENWADSWADVPNVEPISANIGAGGTIGSFQFRVRYGTVKHPGDVSITVQDHTQLNRQWVRVLRSPYGYTDILFQGRAETDTRQVFGAASGVQTFTAYDGNHLLSKIQVKSSRYTDKNNDDVDAFETSMLLPFNQHPISKKKTANKSLFKYPASTGEYFVFRNDGEPWTVGDAIEYLFGEFVYGDASQPVWTISGSIPHELEPMSFEGKGDVLSMLKKLVDQNTGYSFAVLPASDGFQLKLFSMAVSEVTFGSVTIPANPDSVVVSVATNPEIELRLEESQIHVVDRIEVLGERMVVCRSFSAQSGHLQKGWPEDTQFGSLIHDYLNFANDDARRDKKYKNLWCRFVANIDAFYWNGAVHPTLEDDGTVETATAAPVPVHSSALDWLPLIDGNDYSAGEPAPVEDGDFMPPMLFVQEEDNTWRELEDLEVDASLSVIADEIGINIRTAIPHVFALGPYAFSDIGGKVPPLYRTADAVLTAAFRSGQRIRRVYGTATQEGGTLIIEVPDAEFWWVAGGTVIAADGQTVRTAPEMTLRDDGDKLDRIMAGAIARYVSPRGKAAGSARGLFDWHQDIGKVVTTDDPDIESILTSVSWGFENGFRTNFESGFAIR